MRGSDPRGLGPRLFSTGAFWGDGCVCGRSTSDLRRMPGTPEAPISQAFLPSRLPLGVYQDAPHQEDKPNYGQPPSQPQRKALEEVACQRHSENRFAQIRHDFGYKFKAAVIQDRHIPSVPGRDGGFKSIFIASGFFALCFVTAAQPAQAEAIRSAEPGEAIDLLEEGPRPAPISGEALRRLLADLSPVIVVDAREPASYLQGHLPRAINVPAADVETLGPALPKDAQIVVYCGGPECPHSAIVARWLAERGWTNVRHYEEGIAGWTQAGYPVEGGEA